MRKEKYQKLIDGMLTEDEKKDPENGETAIHVLSWWAHTEEAKKAGEHKEHFLREEEESVQNKISKQNTRNHHDKVYKIRFNLFYIWGQYHHHVNA